MLEIVGGVDAVAVVSSCGDGGDVDVVPVVQGTELFESVGLFQGRGAPSAR
ncbi:hypothetical protein OG728_00670 [Streptomyces microflavus]|uniref:hypothetical protein n=1 Tax=Streptomyces microflavus TaxID=1919 RepID=UPI002E0F0591|nr:hypothetical protein OG728_00670 [Streptomyces microflavus]